MATGVGRATTEAVVLSFVLILLSDYVLTSGRALVEGV